MRGEGSVAGEGRVFGVAKFHPWGKCTMPFNVYIMWVLSFTSWVVNFMGLIQTTKLFYNKLCRSTVLLKFDNSSTHLASMLELLLELLVNMYLLQFTTIVPMDYSLFPSCPCHTVNLSKGVIIIVSKTQRNSLLVGLLCSTASTQGECLQIRP